MSLARAWRQKLLGASGLVLLVSGALAAALALLAPGSRRGAKGSFGSTADRALSSVGHLGK